VKKEKSVRISYQENVFPASGEITECSKPARAPIYRQIKGERERENNWHGTSYATCEETVLQADIRHGEEERAHNNNGGEGGRTCPRMSVQVRWVTGEGKPSTTFLVERGKGESLMTVKENWCARTGDS